MGNIGKTNSQKNTSLADALFSKTQKQVLALLFGNPNRSFFLTEIMDLLDAGRGAVQRELKKLTESGLINSFRVGNQRHFKANTESPVYEELSGLIRKTVGLAEPLRAALKTGILPIRLALVFGSVGNQTETASSDIDLLLVGDDLTLEAVYRALEPLETELSRKINPLLYTNDEFETKLNAKNPLLMNILRSKIQVITGEIPNGV